MRPKHLSPSVPAALWPSSARPTHPRWTEGTQGSGGATPVQHMYPPAGCTPRRPLCGAGIDSARLPASCMQGVTHPPSLSVPAVTSGGHAGISFLRVVGQGARPQHTQAAAQALPNHLIPPVWPGHPGAGSSGLGALSFPEPPVWTPSSGLCSHPCRIQISGDVHVGLGPGFVQARALSPLAGSFPDPPCCLDLAGAVP